MYTYIRKRGKKRKETTMTKFETGKTYTANSICNHECVWTYEVIARTEKTITVTDGTETKKLRIIKGLSEMDNRECVYPLGKYSMAPILRA